MGVPKKWMIYHGKILSKWTRPNGDFPHGFPIVVLNHPEKWGKTKNQNQVVNLVQFGVLNGFWMVFDHLASGKLRDDLFMGLPH